MNTMRAPARFTGPALAALVPLVFLLPLANKAYHIDDTLFLAVAQQIHNAPLDYYGFELPWGGAIRPATDAIKNPPGASYLWAAVSAVFGWGEIPLHVAAALVAALFGLGTYYVARRFTTIPLVATLIAVVGPGFLVSANTVMSDVPMMTAYVWAILLWLKGVDSSPTPRLALPAETSLREVERTREPQANPFAHLYLIAAALLIAAATLTKYFAITALPLLLVYTLLHQRRLDPRLAYLFLPIAIVALYQWHSANLYGENLLGSAAGYAVGFATGSADPLLVKTGVALAFAGGSFAAILFYAPLLWRWPILVFGAALIVALTAYFLTFDELDRIVIRTGDHLNWWFPFQLALWIVVGIAIVALALHDLVRYRNAAAALLFLWFIGTFLFSAYLNWTVNVRTLIPMAPALGILAARRLELRFPAERLKQFRFHAVPLALAALLTALVLYADYRLAGAGRIAAATFARDAAEYGRPYYYKGHWGFQYYMNAAGMPAFSPQSAEYTPGDRIVVPLNNTVSGQFHPAVARAYRNLRLEVPTLAWLTTMHRRTGAGFYMHDWGILPFAFGPVPAEEYAVFELGNYLPPDAPVPAGPVPLDYYLDENEGR